MNKICPKQAKTGKKLWLHVCRSSIYNKERNRVLRGTKQPNGKYEYESPVSYWMPFNKGIGLHDASWRSTFGRDIYINSGSHGCINLPTGFAGSLYSQIYVNLPVVVYR